MTRETVMRIVELEISKIRVEKRIREDTGEIEALAGAIEEKGLLQPITVSSDMRLLAGGRRLLAHQHLKRTHIRAIIRDLTDSIDAEEVELVENVARKDLTWQEEARLQYRIYRKRKDKDRKWSQEKQARVTGRQQPEIHRLLELGEALEGGDNELEKCVTKDQAWKVYKALDEEMGKQALREMLERDSGFRSTSIPEWASRAYIIGNCLEEMPKIQSESFHFAEVDPPYGVDLDKRKSRNTDDNMSEYNEWDDFEVQFTLVAQEVYRLLKPDSFAVFWYGMSWHTEVMAILRKVGFAIPDIPCVWTKPGSGQTASPDTTLGSCYEPFFLARKGKPKLAKVGRGNVFDFKPLHPTIKRHPTEKPCHMLRDILTTVCFPGSTILVPFLGSGVTLQAAQVEGHNAMGWDLSEEYRRKFLEAMSETIETEEVEEEEEDA